MEKDLKSIKKTVSIVSGDKDINELVTEYINKDYDCFGRAYLEGHGECKQCVIISEYKDFSTGAMRREPLWLVCLETCKFLEDKASQPEKIPAEIKEEEKERGVENDMLENETQKEPMESLAEKEPELMEKTEAVEEAPVKPRKRSINTTGHSKTMYRTCSKCGGKKSMYETTYNNAIKKFGSAEEMNKKYLCKKCRKEQ